MPSRCDCHSVSVMVGIRAATHANRFLIEVASGENEARLMRCWMCGAYWELLEDELGEGSRRVRLRRIRTADAINDWSINEGEDRT